MKYTLENMEWFIEKVSKVKMNKNGKVTGVEILKKNPDLIFIKNQALIRWVWSYPNPQMYTEKYSSNVIVI